MEKKTIGKFIAVLRKANGMTQKELGDKLLVSDKTVSRWERDENTPDLSLIPTIAEIFGITTDELLRGEKNAQSSDLVQNDTKVKAKSDKQFRFMLNKKYLQYKNLSLISCSVLTLAVIVAAICDLSFYKGILGFWLGTVCVIIAAVLQYSFHTNLVIQIDDEEEKERTIEIKKFNTKLKKIEITMFIASLVVFAFLLPLGMFNMAYTGLDASAWLLYGSAFAVIVLILSCAVYVFKIKKSLYLKEDLHFEEKEEIDNQYAKQLFKEVFKVAGIMVAVTAIVIGIVGNFGFDWFKRYETFDNYDDFKVFMEQLALEEEFGNIDESAIPEDELELFYAYANIGQIEDKNGNVLCEYIEGISTYSEIAFSFDESEDGLPIKVLTNEAGREAFAIRSTITSLLGVVIGVEVVVSIVYYLYMLHKRRIKN